MQLSSLRKNLSVEPLLSFLMGSGCALAFGGRFCCSTRPLLRRDQFRDADQVIGDQVEQEVGGDAGDAAMFGLAHGAVPSSRAAPRTILHACAWNSASVVGELMFDERCFKISSQLCGDLQ
jgi:hypothetical protein